MTHTAECPYCGKEFHAETKIQAETQEGEHRAQQHLNQSQEQKQDTGRDTTISGGKNIVNKWKNRQEA